MRTPSVQAAFYKSLLKQFQRLLQITAPGKNPGRKASSASLSFVQSLSDTWKSLYPYTLIGKMIRFYRANHFGDSDKITHTRVALHTKSQYYAEKLKCILKDIAYAKSCWKGGQVGGMRTLAEPASTYVGGTIKNKGNSDNSGNSGNSGNDTWGSLNI